MNDLNRALGDIRSIRRQIAESTQFRGYGPLALATTGLFAIAAAAAQALWLPYPAAHILRYIALWSATAMLSVGLMTAHAITRSRRVHSGLADEMIRLAAGQFLPSIIAGALLTFVLARYVPGILWTLPGLWQVLFSLGIFASRRFLPGSITAAGVWFLGTGLCTIALGGPRALSPWTMGIAFGAGQLLVAAILFLNATESADESQTEREI